MRIAPPKAPKTGYYFGKGVYFARTVLLNPPLTVSLSSMSSPSLPSSLPYLFYQFAYFNLREAPTAVLLLGKVALRDMNQLKHYQYIEKAPTVPPHLSPLTSHLSPLTSHLSPLTSLLSPLSSLLSPLSPLPSPLSLLPLPLSLLPLPLSPSPPLPLSPSPPVPLFSSLVLLSPLPLSPSPPVPLFSSLVLLSPLPSPLSPLPVPLLIIAFRRDDELGLHLGRVRLGLRLELGPTSLVVPRHVCLMYLLFLLKFLIFISYY